MDRSALIADLVLYIKSTISELALVKAYEGEFLNGGEKFLERIRGLLPCVLVVCDSISAAESSGDVKITVKLLVATKDFTGSDNIPRIYSLSDTIIKAVNCYKPDLDDTFDWYEFEFERHVAHNGFFTLYQQQYIIMQRLCDCCLT